MDNQTEITSSTQKEKQTALAADYLKARIDTTPIDINKFIAKYEKSPKPKTSDSKLFMRALLSRKAPAELVIPKSQQLFSRSFTPKFQKNMFLGSYSFLEKSLESEQFRQVRLMARSIYNQGEDSLIPSEKALQRTQQAVQIFFNASYRLLKKTGKTFPLANKNKCLGMVAVPNSSLVMIAISQDKTPESDKILRENIVMFLDELNTELKNESCDCTFKLACIPTHSQYLMPRTLTNDFNFPATKDNTEPHTRCVEVALMVALNKIGRTKQFTPQEVGVMAFGGTLWSTPDKQQSIAIDCFAGAPRNKKYVEKEPIQISLENGNSAWVDIWEPCSCHCAIYKHQMTAIAAAGGPGTNFAEPCYEEKLISRPQL